MFNDPTANSMNPTRANNSVVALNIIFRIFVFLSSIYGCHNLLDIRLQSKCTMLHKIAMIRSEKEKILLWLILRVVINVKSSQPLEFCGINAKLTP